MKGAGGKYYEGIASISAVLRQNNHVTKLFHITDYIDCERFIDIYARRYADADIVAFSATTNAFFYSAKYAKELKKRFGDIITICGGTHPTLYPAEAIGAEGIDIICVGEGEYPMAELCSRLQAGGDITDIENLWIKRGDRIFENPVRGLIRELDSLPMPDRHIFDFESSEDKRLKRLVFMGSRGCPFNCAHCCNHALRKTGPDSGPYVRFKSVGRLISEIKSCLAQYDGIEHIIFHDDILNLKRSWFAEFANRYKQQIKLPYVCNSRFDLLDESAVNVLRQSGCMQLNIGLESGDDYIRREVLNRNQSAEQIVRAGDLCRANGIKLYVFTMVGIPNEDMRRALNTVKLTAKLRPDIVQTSVYYPYAQTALHELCKQKGYLSERRLDSYFEADTVLNLPDFSKDEILFAYQNFKVFVSYYVTAKKMGGPLGSMLEKIIDFLWLHRRIYLSLEPVYRSLKKVYKRFFKRR
jgi:radical SAM superfamily enzyme YgiQ (UPF0313 family)